MWVDGQLPGRGHCGDAQELGDAAALGEVRLQNLNDPVLDDASELEASVVILAGGQGHAAEGGGNRIASMVVGGERLFEPAHVVRLQSRHHLPHVSDVISGIGIDEDRQLIAKRLTHRGNAFEIAGRRVA